MIGVEAFRDPSFGLGLITCLTPRFEAAPQIVHVRQPAVDEQLRHTGA